MALTKEEKQLVKKEASSVLRELGISPRLLGYQYLVEAICYCVEDSKLINTITYDIYLKIAEEYKTTIPRVERNIRSAIEKADREEIIHFFGNLLKRKKKKPTNVEFISTIAEEIKFLGDFE